jgi:hypothetical protein
MCNQRFVLLYSKKYPKSVSKLHRMIDVRPVVYCTLHNESQMQFYQILNK